MIKVSLYTFIFVYLLTGCMTRCRKADVAELLDLRIEYIENNNRKLNITGWLVHSALGVQAVRQEVNNDKIIVVFCIGSIGTGAFDYSLTIPAGITEVAIGKEDNVIWENGFILQNKHDLEKHWNHLIENRASLGLCHEPQDYIRTTAGQRTLSPDRTTIDE